jgi:N-acetylmuramoyl-L-alanine amidase
MNTQVFFDKWNGKYLDFDGHWGYQCMDLLRQYLKECLGLNPYDLPAVQYAKQVFQNFNPSNTHFTKIVNTPSGVPLKGDIIFWNYYPFVTGWAGHVALCMTASVNNLITFDQNYPTNSPCHYQKHNYRGVMGWLSPKV